MKENGALAIDVVQKLKKEYCVEIRLQRTAFLMPHTTCAINAWKILRGLWTMSMAEVIKSIEREALREAQSQEISGLNNKPVETSFGVDISQNAVERYAETHLGRKPRNHQEFCAAREAKIIEESKEL